MIKASSSSLLKYYRLAKPGIVYGNLLSAAGGFLLASAGHINFWLLAAMAAGTSLIVASACVFNNYLDRDIDTHMARTKARSLVRGDISSRNALVFAAVLGLAGVAILALYTPAETLTLGIIGFVSYVCIYTYYKRETEYATLIGTIPGATPIAAGYAAAAGRLDTAAVLLFVIMVIWQLPHFYAIAMFRREEYAAAGIPVLSVTRGMRVSKVYILWSIVAFAAAAGILGLYGYAGFTYFVVMALVSGYWLWVAGQTYRSGVNDARWARQIFGASLLVLLVFCVMLSLDAWLP